MATNTYTNETGTYTPETRIDGQGNPYTVNTRQDSNVISSANMSPTPTVTVPPPPTDTNNYNGIVASGSALIPPPVTEDPQKALKDYAALLGTPPSAADAYNTAYNDTGIAEKQKAVNDLSAQLASITAEGQQANLQLEQNAGGKDVTTQFLGRQQQEVSRQTAIKSLPIQAQLAAAQGNLTLATDKLNTLFKLKSDDINNQYNYNKDLLQKNYDIMTTAQKEKADAKQKADDRAYTLMMDNQSYARDIAKIAQDSNQYDIAGQIAQIDWTKSTAQKELADLQSKIQMSPMAKLDIAIKQQQLAKAQKENALLSSPSTSETKATTAALQSAKNSIPVIQDKLDLIDILKTSPGLAERVGPNALSRLSPATNKGITGIPGNIIGGIKNIFMHPINEVTGKGEQFKGGIQRLTTGLSLDALINAKKNGATFGALSDAEMRILANSATQLNNWEIKDDKGNPTGVWNIDQKSFKTELDRIRTFLQKSLETTQGTMMSPDEQSTMDELFTNQDASAFY